MTLCAWEEPAGSQAQPGKAIVRLPSLDELAKKWVRVLPMLKRATDRTACYEPIDVLQMAMRGQVGIWFCETAAGRLDAVVVTEIKQYPRQRGVDILFAGGSNMKSWIKPLRAAIDEHARQAGCDFVAGMGRAGWLRAWGGRTTGDIVVTRRLEEVSQ